MKTEIIVALITLAGTILSGVISLLVSQKLVSYRIDRLEKKVDIHNGYAEKFASATKDIALIQKDIEYLKNKK